MRLPWQSVPRPALPYPNNLISSYCDPARKAVRKWPGAWAGRPSSSEPVVWPGQASAPLPWCAPRSLSRMESPLGAEGVAEVLHGSRGAP